MKVTAEMRAGIVGLMHIAKDESKKFNSQAIADGQNLSKPFTDKVFSQLRKANLVKPSRGPGGGFKLAKNSDEITIKDIIDCFKVKENKKFEKELKTTEESNKVSDFFQNYEAVTRKMFEKVSLKELNENPEVLLKMVA